MTLWRKAWRESRVRFLVSAAAIAGLCLGRIEQGHNAVAAQLEQPSHVMLVNLLVNGSPVHVLAFVVLTMLLGLGGFQRERAFGTAAFTLALPVTRLQLVTSRATLGLLQTGALALVPAIVIPTLSPFLWHEAYPVSQGLLFTLRFAGWGAVWFGVAFLWSTLFRSEYTAAVVSTLTPFVYMPVYVGFFDGERRWPSANFFVFMHGGSSMDRATGLIHGVPWSALLAMVAVTVGLLAVAAMITKRQEF